MASLSVGYIALSTTTIPEGITIFEPYQWPWVIKKRLTYVKSILLSKDNKFAIHVRNISIKYNDTDTFVYLIHLNYYALFTWKLIENI